MSNFLSSTVNNYSGSGTNGNPWSGREERRFLYSLSESDVPQFVLVQRLGESDDGASSAWRNDSLYYYNIAPESHEQYRIGLNSGGDAGNPYYVSYEKHQYDDTGFQFFNASYSDDNFRLNTRTQFVFDRSNSSLTWNSYYRDGDPEYQNDRYYFKLGTPQLRLDSQSGPLAADLSVSGDQSAGYNFNVNTYAPYWNSDSNGRSQASFTNFGGSFEQIAARNIALDLLGWGGDGFMEGIYNAVLNNAYPGQFKSGIVGLVPVSQSNSDAQSRSSRSWTYSNSLPIIVTHNSSGVYEYEGSPVSYSNFDQITGTYTSTPLLISSALTSKEQSDLRAALEFANISVLDKNGHPLMSIQSLPEIIKRYSFSGQGSKYDLASEILGYRPEFNPASRDITETTFVDVAASSWSGQIKINRVSSLVNDPDGSIWAKQIVFGTGQPTGSILVGTNNNDVLRGMAGWDIIDGGGGDDFVRAGNGRDIITGGLGSDTLHGDFGWNTYTSERDGFVDTIVVKSDQHLYNWLLEKSENNADGSKCDVIEGLDPTDNILILGVETSDLRVQSGAVAHNLSGIGIYAKGALEALYTGGDLSVDDISRMVAGQISV